MNRSASSRPKSKAGTYGYAQTDAAAARAGADHRYLPRGFRAAVDAPRVRRGAGNGRTHRAPPVDTGLDPREPRGSHLEYRGNHREHLRARRRAGAMRARIVLGDARLHVAAARAPKRRPSSHPDLRPQSGFEPAREPLGTEAAAAGTADRRSCDRPLAPRELGCA